MWGHLWDPKLWDPDKKAQAREHVIATATGLVLPATQRVKGVGAMQRRVYVKTSDEGSTCGVLLGMAGLG